MMRGRACTRDVIARGASQTRARVIALRTIFFARVRAVESRFRPSHIPEPLVTSPSRSALLTSTCCTSAEAEKLAMTTTHMQAPREAAVSRRAASAASAEPAAFDPAAWQKILHVVRMQHPTLNRVWFDQMTPRLLTNG